MPASKFSFKITVAAAIAFAHAYADAALTVTTKDDGPVTIVYGSSGGGTCWSYYTADGYVCIDISKPLAEHELTISGTERDFPVNITVQATSNGDDYYVNIEDLVIHGPDKEAGVYGSKHGCALYFTDGEQGSVNLKVTGNCEIISDADYPGVKVVGKGKMKINGNGKLVAKGGKKGGGGAGVGGDSGGMFTSDIEISDVTIEAEGGGSAAGIGCGGKKQEPDTVRGGNMGSITISNATITAVGGGGGGAGIGGGLDGTNGMIKVIGGFIKAIGAAGAASIGKGAGVSQSGKIVFQGGNIVAPQGVIPQPVNLLEQILYLVICGGFTPPACRPLSDFTGFPDWFDTDGICSDDLRKAWFWLPGDAQNGIHYELGIENITASADVYDENATPKISGFAMPSAMEITSIAVTNGMATLTVHGNLTGWQDEDWLEYSEFIGSFKTNFEDSAKSRIPQSRDGAAISFPVSDEAESGFWRVISK